VGATGQKNLDCTCHLKDIRSTRFAWRPAWGLRPYDKGQRIGIVTVCIPRLMAWASTFGRPLHRCLLTS
jgi:hypothetical protein